MTHGGTVSFERGREGRRVAVQCSQRATHHARSRIARTQWSHPDVPDGGVPRTRRVDATMGTPNCSKLSRTSEGARILLRCCQKMPFDMLEFTGRILSSNGPTCALRIDTMSVRCMRKSTPDQNCREHDETMTIAAQSARHCDEV